jgi:hypothetical protein
MNGNLYRRKVVLEIIQYDRFLHRILFATAFYKYDHP